MPGVYLGLRTTYKDAMLCVLLQHGPQTCVLLLWQMVRRQLLCLVARAAGLLLLLLLTPIYITANGAMRSSYLAA